MSNKFCHGFCLEFLRKILLFLLKSLVTGDASVVTLNILEGSFLMCVFSTKSVTYVLLRNSLRIRVEESKMLLCI